MDHKAGIKIAKPSRMSIDKVKFVNTLTAKGQGVFFEIFKMYIPAKISYTLE